MRTVRNICWSIGMLIVFISACFFETDNHIPYIVVTVGLAVMLIGIVINKLLDDEEEYYFENEK